MSTGDLVGEFWRQQSVWSQTANRMRRRIARARACALAMAVAGAVAGTVAAVLHDEKLTASRVFAAAAAAAIGVLPFLRPVYSGPVLRDWTRARSVSEALKSEVYLWLARIGDYRSDEAAARLTERTNAIRSDGADLLRHQAGIAPVERALPAVHDAPSYFAVRVSEQIDGYYRARAAGIQRVLRRFEAGELALALGGLALGVAAAASGSSGYAPWIAVLTTLTGAVGVHVAAGRYEFQLIEFLRTADRLDQLRTRAAVETSADALDRLAADAENVISVENQGWMAKLAEDPPAQRLGGA